jgi:hypothetical protein
VVVKDLFGVVDCVDFLRLLMSTGKEGGESFMAFSLCLQREDCVENLYSCSVCMQVCMYCSRSWSRRVLFAVVRSESTTVQSSKWDVLYCTVLYCPALHCICICM